MDNQNGIIQQPKPRNPNDLLIVHNIDTEDHEWFYNSAYEPLPYYLKAGEIRKIPFYIGRHGVEKLIDKILQKQGKIHTSELFRAELRKQIVLGIEHINLIREKTANEIALEEMQRKKNADPYEELFKEREVAAEQQRAAELASQKPPEAVIQTQGVPVNTPPAQPTVNPSAVNPALQPNGQATPTTTPTPSVDAASNPPQADPERVQAYTILQTRLHLDLSHEPTKQKFDATPLDQLKAEFADQVPEWADPNKQPGVPVATQPGLHVDAPPPPVIPRTAQNPVMDNVMAKSGL